MKPKKDPTKTWRKTMRRLFANTKPPEIYFTDTAEEIERAMLANEPDRRRMKKCKLYDKCGHAIDISISELAAQLQVQGYGLRELYWTEYQNYLKTLGKGGNDV